MGHVFNTIKFQIISVEIKKCVRVESVCVGVVGCWGLVAGVLSGEEEANHSYLVEPLNEKFPPC